MKNIGFKIKRNKKISLARLLSKSRQYILVIILCLTNSFLLGKDAAKETASSSGNNITQILNYDGINIKALVQAQIDSAQKRETRGEIKSFSAIFQPVTNKIKPVKDESKLQKQTSDLNWLPDFFNGETDLKILIIAVFSALIFGFVFTRRIIKKDWKRILINFFKAKKKIKVNLPKINLKKNINSIREEQSITAQVPELNQIRSELVKQSSQDSFGTSISNKAKELKIAKGEIMLAAKIKSFQLAQLSTNNK